MCTELCQTILSTTSSKCNKMSEWIPRCAALKRTQCCITMILSRGLFPKSRKGRKREDTVFLFSEWRVLEVRTGFHTETMARVHPAALSLLLSRPILRLSICLWAETHGTSSSAQHASQKFTSCSSAFLLYTNPIPRTWINRPSYAPMA